MVDNIEDKRKKKVSKSDSLSDLTQDLNLKSFDNSKNMNNTNKKIENLLPSTSSNINLEINDSLDNLTSNDQSNYEKK